MRVSEYHYTESRAGAPRHETIAQCENRERYWRSLGKKIRAGAKIRKHN